MKRVMLCLCLAANVAACAMEEDEAGVDAPSHVAVVDVVRTDVPITEAELDTLDWAARADIEGPDEQAHEEFFVWGGVDGEAEKQCSPYSGAACGWGGNTCCTAGCVNPIEYINPPTPSPNQISNQGCCYCTDALGRCMSAGACQTANRLYDFSLNCPSGVFCDKCKDIDPNSFFYSPEGHGAGPDGVCNGTSGDDDLTSYHPPPP
jgi:hypothetical protein